MMFSWLEPEDSKFFKESVCFRESQLFEGCERHVALWRLWSLAFFGTKSSAIIVPAASLVGF